MEKLKYLHAHKRRSTKEPKDVTDILDDACEKMALKACNDDLCGFVLKSASPSCGMERLKFINH